MTFVPKADVLSFEEIERLADVLIERGVKKLRLTGGEPLVAKGVMGLIEHLGAHVRAGRLEEGHRSTNGTQLAQHAEGLAAAGLRRIMSRSTRSTARRSGASPAAMRFAVSWKGSPRRRPQV